MKSEIYRYDSSKDIILIPGKIFGPVVQRSIQFVFDPGSFQTIITTDITNSVGYKTTSASRRISTTSVTGKDYGYTIIASKLTVLNFNFLNVEIACFDLPSKYNVDGLLGLDLLKHFEIILRHKEHLIQFTRL